MNHHADPAPVEIEFKLAFAPADAQRLREHPRVGAASIGDARVEHLDNRYFDTAERLLARHGMALRLRRNGDRWWQTLKTAGETTGAMSTRREWKMPVAGPRLELARLAKTPLAQLGAPADLGAALVLRYSTDFTRELRVLAFPDGTRAEFAIDRGEIRVDDAHGTRSAPICELELELLEGDPRTLLQFVQKLAHDLPLVPCFDSKAARGDALVDRRLRSPAKMAAVMPAPDQPVATAVAQALTAGLRCLIANLPGAVAPDADTEFVHQARVALRRMRTLIQLHAATIGDADALHKLERRLRDLARVLGAVRDWDVFCESTLPLLREPGAASGDDAVRAALLPALTLMAQTRRKAAHDGLWREMVSCQFAQAMLAIEDTALRLAQRPGATCLDTARAMLDAQHRRTLKHARRLAWDDAQGMHRLRVEVKRLRYLFDFYLPLFPADAARPYAAALLALQARLGRLNDLAVASRLLAVLAHSGSPERLWRTQLAHAFDWHRPKLAIHVMELRAAPRVWANGAHRS